ncbi:MAG: DUF3021 family protein [Clostridiaceae bacterium]
MKILDLIRQLIKDYFIIFGLLIIGSVFLTPDGTISRDYVLLTMTFAAVGDLPSLVFWSKAELTEESMKWRSILHFILLEVVILLYAGMIGLVSGFLEVSVFAVEILIIYLLVRFITWRGDMFTANKINKKLKDFNMTDE